MAEVTNPGIVASDQTRPLLHYQVQRTVDLRHGGKSYHLKFACLYHPTHGLTGRCASRTT